MTHSTKPPLQLLLLRDRRDLDLVPFEEAIERAIKGGALTSGYVASGEDLGVELRRFDYSPGLMTSLESLVDSACHTIVIALVGSVFASNKDWGALTGAIWNQLRPNGRHSLLIFSSNEATGDALLSSAPELRSNNIVALDQLTERALRPAFLSLRVLHECRTRLAGRIRSPGSSAYLTLFISHAKLDGLPLAQSIRHLIGTLPWLTSFYDARDLAGIADWESALENAARSSLLIILRTDNYELRPWCQKETFWAEESAAPTVLVEARPGLVYPAGELPLERMPSVRIPDGNLYRILHAALRESLRHLLFQRRVQEMKDVGSLPSGMMVISFSYPPGMNTLLKACEAAKNEPAIIIYPDPPLRRGLYEAAYALVKDAAPNARLVTPSLLAMNAQ